MQVRESDGDVEEFAAPWSLKVIDGVDFLSPQRRKQSASSAGESILTVQTQF